MAKKIILTIIVITFLVYLTGTFYFREHVLPGTQIGDYVSKNELKSEATEQVTNELETLEIAIDDQVIPNYHPKLVDLGLKFEDEKFVTDLDEGQQAWMWPLQIIKPQTYQLENYLTVDEQKLTKQLEDDGFIKTSKRKSPKSANVEYNPNSQQFELVGKVRGTTLNDKFITDLQTAVLNLNSEFDATKYYQTEVTGEVDNAELVEELNTIISRPVSLEFGDESVAIDSSVIASFLMSDENGEVAIDESAMYNYFYNISLEYDNTRIETDERIVTEYNIDPAYEQIKSSLLDGSADPIIGTTEVNESVEKFKHYAKPTSDSYVEVSIGQQLMWVYKNGELVVQTPVVTGNVAEDWDTPTGTFEVLEKTEDKVLNGASVGFEYEVPVDYWVRLTYTGIGIHDIGWLTTANSWNAREVYFTEGSHGCINTPDDLMKTVYDNVEIGTPVYVTK